MINWVSRERDTEQVNRIAKQHKLNPLLVKIMLNRGLTEQDILDVTYGADSAILDPVHLTNAQKAVQEIIDFIIANPEGIIYVRADYDCDGVTSAYIMGRVLTFVHENVYVDVPQRIEGYGLTLKKAKEIAEASKDKATLVITVDNGVSALDAVEHLLENNVQVIVTDHHESTTGILPNCTVVDPHVHDGDPFGHLAGCGVAFKLCQLLLRAYDAEHLMEELYPALAIGTIADMMPMTKENMVLVKKGLDMMNNEHCPAPIQAFKHFHGKDLLTYTDIGWDIGPTINACGRMGDTTLAAKFLFADGEIEEIIEDVVTDIVGLNLQRQEITKAKTEEALKQVSTDSPINIVKLTDCPEGLAGVVANKVLQFNNKPTVVLVEHGKMLVGSSRGTNGISILEIMKEVSQTKLLHKFGGHDAAAGVSLLTANYDSFVKAMTATTIAYLEAHEITVDEEDITIEYDAELTMADVHTKTLEAINSLPYDKDNFVAPVFKITAEIESCVATKNKPNNGWLTLKARGRSIRFWVENLMPIYAKVNGATQVEILGTLDKNFMTGTPVIIKVIDMRAAE